MEECCTRQLMRVGSACEDTDPTRKPRPEALETGRTLQDALHLHAQTGPTKPRVHVRAMNAYMSELLIG